MPPHPPAKSYFFYELKKVSNIKVILSTNASLKEPNRIVKITLLEQCLKCLSPYSFLIAFFLKTLWFIVSPAGTFHVIYTVNGPAF